MSLSCVVEHPCLASPGPSRTNLSQLGVLACVLDFRLQGFVSIASIELLPAFCLSFYSNMALVLFCTTSMVRGKRSSWHSSSLPVAKGCSPTVRVGVLPSLKLRG